MLFNQHSDLEGRHAFLSPSSYHWLNYDDVKLEARWKTVSASRRGTDLHRLAHEAIRLGTPLARRRNQALAEYVRDAIRWQMVCEQPLYYSDNCFGTADTLCFYDDLLRIHDLKNGVSPTSEKQLEVYAALFCLEYGVDPFEIDIELRIYQRDDIRVYEPTPERILEVMDKIIDSDRRIEDFKGGL